MKSVLRKMLSGGVALKRMVFVFTVILLSSLCITAVFARQQGYVNRFIVDEKSRIMDPVFLDGRLFLVEDNGILHRLNSRGEEEKSFRPEGKNILQIASDDRYILLRVKGNEKDNKEEVLAIDPSSLTVVKSIAVADITRIINYSGGLVYLTSSKIVFCDDKGGNARSFTIPSEPGVIKIVKVLKAEKNIILLVEHTLSSSKKEKVHYIYVFSPSGLVKSIPVSNFSALTLAGSDDKIFFQQKSGEADIYDGNWNLMVHIDLSHDEKINGNFIFMEGERIYFITEKGEIPILTAMDLKSPVSPEGDNNTGIEKEAVSRGKILWRFPLSVYDKIADFTPGGDKIFCSIRHRLGFIIVLRFDKEKGILEDQMPLGFMDGTPLDSENGYLYITHKSFSNKFGLSPGIIVLNRDFTGQYGFDLSPWDKFLMNYSYLARTSYVNEDFDKYIRNQGYSGKANEKIPHNRKILEKAVADYESARSQDPANPFHLLYLVLAKLELGTSPAGLKEEIKDLRELCDYDVYKLTMTAGILSQNRHISLAKEFWEDGVLYSQSFEVDNSRSYQFLLSSPIILFTGINRSMMNNDNYSKDEIMKIWEYWEKIAPSNEFHYPAWAGMHQYWQQRGDKEKARYCAQKTLTHFKDECAYSGVVGLDVLIISGTVVGFLTLILSGFFALKAERRRQHYIGEITDKEQLTPSELYQNYLKPTEKNMLGFLYSLGLLSILTDIVMLLLPHIVHRDQKWIFTGCLAVSVIAGIIIALYMGIARIRIESRHYGTVQILGNGSAWRQILNNSFLGFMEKKEKGILLFLLLLGTLYVIPIQMYINALVERFSTPLAISGMSYGSDMGIRSLNNMMKDQPHNAESHLLLAFGYQKIYRLDQAEKEYNLYLQKSKKSDLGAKANLSLITMTRDPQKGMEELKSITKDPQFTRFPYQDRVYYNLSVMESRLGKSDQSHGFYQQAEQMNPDLVKANSIANPGQCLLIPPTPEQERKGVKFEKSIFISPLMTYLAPLCNEFMSALGTDKGDFSWSSLFFLVPYWLWTLALGASLFTARTPEYFPHTCQRCGKMMCDKCSPKNSHGWCSECMENPGFYIPGVFQLIIPGVRKLRQGKLISGSLLLLAFLWGFTYTFIFFFPLGSLGSGLEFLRFMNFMAGEGIYRYAGPLQSMIIPNVVGRIGYNAVWDPVFQPLVVLSLVFLMGSVLFNILNTLMENRRKKA